jgi:hypothetical protein
MMMVMMIMMMMMSRSPFGPVGCERPLRGRDVKDIQPHATLHRSFLAVHFINIRGYLMMNKKKIKKLKKKKKKMT